MTLSPSPFTRRPLSRWAGAAALGLFAAGCSDSSVTGPQLPPGTNQSALHATMGGESGTGGVSVTPRAVPQGYFTADIKVRLQGAKPNTVYTVQRAPEIGRSMSNDGICQRALGLSPWSPSDPPAPSFVTFMQPAGAGPYTVTTSASGDAALDFTFSAPTIPAGTQFDVMFRLIDNTTAPTSVYLSGCFTVTVL